LLVYVGEYALPERPVKIEDLPADAQIIVLVRELFALAALVKANHKAHEERLRAIEDNVQELRLWRAKITGVVAAASAIGGVVGAVGTALIGKVL
jgi:hypothetical protein